MYEGTCNQLQPRSTNGSSAAPGGWSPPARSRIIRSRRVDRPKLPNRFANLEPELRDWTAFQTRTWHLPGLVTTWRCSSPVIESWQKSEGSPVIGCREEAPIAPARGRRTHLRFPLPRSESHRLPIVISSGAALRFPGRRSFARTCTDDLPHPHREKRRNEYQDKDPGQHAITLVN